MYAVAAAVAYAFAASDSSLSCRATAWSRVAHSVLSLEPPPPSPAARSGRRRCQPQGSSPELPELRPAELRRLTAGKRVQRQDLRSGSGTGFAVQDICADPDAAWDCVSDFAGYKRRIGTVRKVEAYRPERVVPGTCCYRFTVSRLGLLLDVRFAVDEEQRYARWTLEQPSWVQPAALLAGCPLASGPPDPRRSLVRAGAVRLDRVLARAAAARPAGAHPRLVRGGGRARALRAKLCGPARLAPGAAKGARAAARRAASPDTRTRAEPRTPTLSPACRLAAG